MTQDSRNVPTSQDLQMIQAKDTMAHVETTESREDSKHESKVPVLERMSFRERLRQDMKRFDGNAKTSLAHHSHLISIPVELRQHILDNVLDDEELPHADLPEESRRLRLVCKGFRTDMEWVSRQWQQRKEALALARKGEFGSYIADLMAPIEEARKISAAPWFQKRRKENRQWYDKQRTQRKKELSVMSTAAQPRGATSTSSARWAPRTPTELADANVWRQLRNDKVKEGKLKAKEKAKEESKQAKRVAKATKKERSARRFLAMSQEG